MRKWIAKQSPSRRGIGKIMSGSVLSQLIILGATPILTRLYPPDSYGTFSYLVSISAIIAVIATFRLEAAIPLAVDDNSARGVIRTSIVSTLCASAAVVFVGYAILPAISVQDTPLNASSGLWVAGLVLTTALFAILSQCALRRKLYGSLAKRSVTQSIGIVGGQFGFSLLSNGGAGLLSGQLFGRIVGSVLLLRECRSLLSRPVRGTKRRVLRRYWRFPVIFTPSAVMNAAGPHIPLLLIGYWYGAAAAGQFGLAQRLTLAPVALVGSAMAAVFGAEVASRIRNGTSNNRKIFLKASFALSLASLPIFTVLMLLSPFLFPLVFGDEWVQAGLFAQAAALSAGFGMIVSPLSRVFSMYQRGRASLLVDITRPILVIGGAYLAHKSGWGPVGTIWGALTGQAINYGLTWCVALHIVTKGLAK